MSKYSGKCDFADHIDIYGIDSVVKSHIYLGYNNYKSGISLNINSIRDAMPFYTHIISFAALTNCVGHIVLSERSWIDIEEENMLKTYKNMIVREYRRCKRKKIEFIPEDILERCFLPVDNEVLKQIIDRVAKEGESASIAGIHVPCFDRMRKRLGDDIKQYDKEHNKYGE